MVSLRVTFKSNTDGGWTSERLLKIGKSKHFRVDDFIRDGKKLIAAIVLVPEEDEIYYSRAIRMISPQIVSVSRA